MAAVAQRLMRSDSSTTGQQPRTSHIHGVARTREERGASNLQSFVTGIDGASQHLIAGPLCHWCRLPCRSPTSAVSLTEPKAFLFSVHLLPAQQPISPMPRASKPWARGDAKRLTPTGYELVQLLRGRGNNLLLSCRLGRNSGARSATNGCN